MPTPNSEEFQPLTITKPSGHSTHMGLRPHFILPHVLQPFSSATQSALPNANTADIWSDTSSQLKSHPCHHSPEFSPAAHSSQDSPGSTNSKNLEYHLESTLATVLNIQTSGISSSAEILTPRAQNILRMINALVSTDISSPRTSARRRRCPGCELSHLW